MFEYKHVTATTDAVDRYLSECRSIANASAPPEIGDKAFFIAFAALTVQVLVKGDNRELDGALRGIVGTLKMAGVKRAMLTEALLTVVASQYEWVQLDA